MGLHFSLRRWRKPVLWTVIALVILEFPLTISTLALFGIADPDTYRTRLWQDGSSNGFNSDPTAPLYAAANYQSIKVPIIWNGFVTKYNLVISVLSMFILLLKAVLVPMHALFPIFSFLIHAIEVGLWSYSVYGQTSPDTIDPKGRRQAPWYITKSCNVVFKQENKGYCQQAKASFYVTVVMLALFILHIILALFSVFFAPPYSPSDDERSIASSLGKSRASEIPSEREWELVRIPDTPGSVGAMKSPMTPRTRAFNDLDGGYSAAGGQQLPPWKMEKSEKMPWSPQ